MVDFIIDIEISLTLQELTDLKALAELKGLDLAVVARNCMNERCKELLSERKPKTSSVARANRRPAKKDVPNKARKGRAISKTPTKR